MHTLYIWSCQVRPFHADYIYYCEPVQLLPNINMSGRPLGISSHLHPFQKYHSYKVTVLSVEMKTAGIRVWEDAPWPNKKFKITEIIEKTHKHKSAGDEWAGWGRAHPSPHWCAWQHRCDRISQITFSTLGTLCLGGDYYCHSFNGLAWTSAGSANGVWIPHISIAIRGPARQQQVGDWQMEVAAQQTWSQSKAKQRGANYVRRNRVIHHSVRHLSSHTKETR